MAVTLWAVLCALWLACAFAGVPYQQVPIPGTRFSVVWKAGPGTAPCVGLLLVVDPSSSVSPPLLASQCDAPLISLATGVLYGPPVSSEGGYTLLESVSDRSSAWNVTTLSSSSSNVTVTGTVGDAGSTYSLVFTAGPSDNQAAMLLSLQLAPASEASNRVYLTFASSPKEGVVGLGTQYSQWDLKGTSQAVLVTEQGVGRGLEPITWFLNTFGEGSGGYWHTTYSSVPLFYTTQGRGFVFEGGNTTSMYGFNFTDPNSIDVQLWLPPSPLSLTATVYLVAAAQPKGFIQEATLHTGRMLPLPAWTQTGAVVGFQGGTAAVLNMTAQLAQHNVPVAAMWLQDWTGVDITPTGTRLWWNWESDPQWYPDWPGMIATLEQQGVRTLGYINPYLVNQTGRAPGSYSNNYFQEAADHGYLVANSSGQPYLMESLSFTFGTIDVTNPSARAWYKGLIAANMLNATAGRQSGWMCDFGEYLPFDAVLHSGAPAAVVHNQFPELWASLNREAVQEAGLEGEVAFFTRSGFTHTPSVSTLMWMGDQLVTWDLYDGIKSAVLGMLSAGFSGWSLTHTDIGGYTMVSNAIVTYARSKELLLRWMELSAYEALYRTHLGVIPATSAQFYTDNDTWAGFGRFARVHSALGPYRTQLMAEAAATGAPLIRHMWLEFPDDPAVFPLIEQFMFGSDILAAPVLSPNVTTLSLYLPAGVWTHVWSGTVYTSAGMT